MISQGGRKYAVTVYALTLFPLLVLLEAPSDVYMAVSVIVGAFCGGNAVIEWKHASKTGAPAPSEG